MSRLVSLPQELQILILSLAEPMDVLSVRRTCRTLYETTYSVFLWTTLLSNACRIYNIYKGTFCPEQMSQASLEAAVLRPHRFTRALWHHSPQKPFLIHRKRAILEGQDPAWFNCILVPGGRYLLTLRPTLLQLWDMGSGFSTECLAETLVATTQIQGMVMYVTRVWVAGSGSKIRICIVLGSPTECSVYEIETARLPPTFTLLSTNSLFMQLRDKSCFWEDLGLNILPKAIISWNVVTNETAIFPTQITPEVSFPISIFFDDRLLFVDCAKPDVCRAFSWKDGELTESAAFCLAPEAAAHDSGIMAPIEIFEHDGTVLIQVRPPHWMGLGSLLLSFLPKNLESPNQQAHVRQIEMGGGGQSFNGLSLRQVIVDHFYQEMRTSYDWDLRLVATLLDIPDGPQDCSPLRKDIIIPLQTLAVTERRFVDYCPFSARMLIWDGNEKIQLIDCIDY